MTDIGQKYPLEEARAGEDEPPKLPLNMEEAKEAQEVRFVLAFRRKAGSFGTRERPQVCLGPVRRAVPYVDSYCLHGGLSVDLRPLKTLSDDLEFAGAMPWCNQSAICVLYFCIPPLCAPLRHLSGGGTRATSAPRVHPPSQRRARSQNPRPALSPPSLPVQASPPALFCYCHRTACPGMA